MTSAEVRQRIVKSLELTYDAPGEHDWTVIAGWVADLHEIQEESKRLKNELLRYLHEAMPEYEVGLPVGSFRKTSGKSAMGWDHAMVGSALAARVADEWEDEPPAIFAEKVTKRILACAGIGYWRKGELKRNGLDPDRYSQEKEGNGPTVIFTPPKQGEAAA